MGLIGNLVFLRIWYQYTDEIRLKAFVYHFSPNMIIFTAAILYIIERKMAGKGRRVVITLTLIFQFIVLLMLKIGNLLFLIAAKV